MITHPEVVTETVGKKKVPVGKDLGCEKRLKKIIKDNADFILYLENNIIHSKNFCLCDFDEVYKVPEDSADTMKLEVKGTELFMSPLVYNTFRYGVKYVIHNPFKSDVYSLGLCFVYAITLSYDVITSIRRNTDEENKALLTEYIGNKNMLDILVLMLKKEERDRVDFIELKEVLDSRGKR